MVEKLPDIRLSQLNDSRVGWAESWENAIHKAVRQAPKKSKLKIEGFGSVVDFLIQRLRILVECSAT